ncbi:hypothetical protein CANARDRAFT_22971 [[Candida] arabinofermentans NRRL YB-2248]|uniref:Uncharacterized protein n=1 Tax=[Candida] arabinofermentans NRRL YB-2248 TaxID=983967 RepID=A0A1E4T136_9ASCO|nr:hypothetical protein CANARDRAFT_22971 [[Candida] arabinofermentans NRRL YB-2248]
MLLQSNKKKIKQKKIAQDDNSNVSSSFTNLFDQNSRVNSLSTLKKSETTILSPHTSIYQTLHNPELDLEMSNIKDPSSVSMYRNNDFSITSWQSISQFQDHEFTFNNNRPQIKLNSNSPNIGSILSSSDNEDRNLDDLNPQSSNHKVIVFDSGSDSDNDKSDDEVGKHFKDVAADEDDEDEGTIDSSTIIPSFIMPRVSIPSLSSSNQVKIQVIGLQKDLLINRLQSYKKLLNQIEFTNSDDSNLIILLVNKENYILPNLINKPFIPIIIGDSFDYMNLNTILQNKMICDPLKLNSISDDLMPLIDFLSSLEPGFNFDSLLIGSNTNFNKLSSMIIDKSTSIDSNNDQNLKKRKRRKSHSTSCSKSHSHSHSHSHPHPHSHSRSHSYSKPSSSSSSKSTSSSSSDSVDDNNNYQSLKSKLIMGIAVGVVSLTVALIYKELLISSSNGGGNSASRVKRLMFAAPAPAPAPAPVPSTTTYTSSSSTLGNTVNKLQEMTSNSIALFDQTMDQFLARLNFDSFLTLENLFKDILNQGFYCLERVKFTLWHLIDLSLSKN